jgi:hypothetical protein
VGGAARISVVNWIKHRGGNVRDPGSRKLHTIDANAIGPKVRLVDVMHPGAGRPGRGRGGGEVLRGGGRPGARLRGRRSRLAAAGPGGHPGGGRHVPVRLVACAAARPRVRRHLAAGTGGTGTVRKDSGRSIILEPRKPLPPRTPFPAERPGPEDGFSAGSGEVPWEPPCKASEFDPGPPTEIARLLVGAEPGLGWPDWKAVGVVGAATYGGGPVYRGRFSGVQLLVLADQAGHDDLMWARAYTGEAGQVFQGLLAALGLTKSYLILRTLPVDTSALAAADVRKLVDRAAVRNLHQAIASEVLGNNPVAAVVAIGAQAQRLAGKLDFGAKSVVPLPAWGSGARDAWAAGLEQLRGAGIVATASRPPGRGPHSRSRSPGPTCRSGRRAGRRHPGTGCSAPSRRTPPTPRPIRSTRCGCRAGSTPWRSRPSDRSVTPGGGPARLVPVIDWTDIDEVVGQNWYRLDPDLADRVRRDCPAEDLDWSVATLDGFGALVGDRIARAADTIDAHPPELVRYDRWANEVGHVAHHPAMLDAKAALWEAGYPSGFEAQAQARGRPRRVWSWPAPATCWPRPTPAWCAAWG